MEWTDLNIIKLIDFVCVNPPLFDVRSKDYRNRNKQKFFFKQLLKSWEQMVSYIEYLHVYKVVNLVVIRNLTFLVYENGINIICSL